MLGPAVATMLPRGLSVGWLVRIAGRVPLLRIGGSVFLTGRPKTMTPSPELPRDRCSRAREAATALQNDGWRV